MRSVRSSVLRMYVCMYVGYRHNPLGLGTNESVSGRFPRYCSRFPTLLRRQRSLGKPGQRTADYIFGTHKFRTPIPTSRISISHEVASATTDGLNPWHWPKRRTTVMAHGGRLEAGGGVVDGPAVTPGPFRIPFDGWETASIPVVFLAGSSAALAVLCAPKGSDGRSLWAWRSSSSAPRQSCARARRRSFPRRPHQAFEGLRPTSARR